MSSITFIINIIPQSIALTKRILAQIDNYLFHKTKNEYDLSFFYNPPRLKSNIKLKK